MNLYSIILRELYEELVKKLVDHHLILYTEHSIGIDIIGKTGRKLASVRANIDGLVIVDKLDNDSTTDYNDPELFEKVTNRLLKLLT